MTLPDTSGLANSGFFGGSMIAKLAGATIVASI